MKLRKECSHGRYDEHAVWQRGIVTTLRGDDCPGGVFLPDDTLVLVYEDVDKELVIDLVLDWLDREAEPDPNQLEVPFKNDRGAW